jgi:large subunit ribosomal protein L9e
MKQIISSNEIDIPKGVKVTIKSRVVTVVGPRGTLVRSFGFLKIDLKVVGDKVITLPTLTLLTLPSYQPYQRC